MARSTAVGEPKRGMSVLGEAALILVILAGLAIAGRAGLLGSTGAAIGRALRGLF
jgi:hypothetical protein